MASGMELLERGRYGYAYVRFRKVLSINAGNDKARAIMDALDIYGYLLHKRPAPGRIERYEKAKARYPDSPYIHMIGAELKLAAGDAGGAITLHREAEALKPGIPHNWFGLGLAYRAAGNPGAARDALQRAADNGRRGLYHLELAHQLFGERDFQLAADAYHRAWEMSPRRIEGRIGELRSLLFAGRYREAAAAGDSLLALMRKRTPKMVRHATRVALVSDLSAITRVEGLALEALERYVVQLHRWAVSLSDGQPVDGTMTGEWEGSSLAPVLALDRSLLR